MTDLRKAAEMALKYFEDAYGLEDTEVAIKEALRKALEQPEQEPLIYIREDTEMPFGGYEHCGRHEPGAFPVYTAPPKREWVGLTDQEKYDVLEGATGDGGRVYYDTLFRCYEAKLKEKNA
jgi:hypothetical protein